MSVDYPIISVMHAYKQQRGNTWVCTNRQYASLVYDGICLDEIILVRKMRKTSSRDYIYT